MSLSETDSYGPKVSLKLIARLTLVCQNSLLSGEQGAVPGLLGGDLNSSMSAGTGAGKQGHDRGSLHARKDTVAPLAAGVVLGIR